MCSSKLKKQERNKKDIYRKKNDGIENSILHSN